MPIPSPSSEKLTYRNLRRAIGWLGVSMPLILILGAALHGCRQLQPTLSHYYFTAAGDLFVGVLFAVGFFLFCYRKERIDNWATNFAGLMAFGIALFPTGEYGGSRCATCLEGKRELASNGIHFGCATLFFLALAFISYFLFTRTHPYRPPTPQKGSRNRLYRICGIAIVVCLVLIGLCFKLPGLQRLAPYRPVFWLEWIAMLAFGISWLVKGEVVLEDRVPST